MNAFIIVNGLQTRKMLLLLLFCVIISSAFAPLPNREERSSEPTVASFLSRLSSLLRAFQQFTRNHDVGNARHLSQPVLERLEEMWGTMQTAFRHFDNIGNELPDNLYQQVHRSMQHIRDFFRILHAANEDSSRTGIGGQSDLPACSSRTPDGVGAPRYDIQRAQLETLLNAQMTMTEIAKSGILGTRCRSTLYNHCRQLNIPLPRQRYTTISDEDLRHEVREVNQQQPRSGSEEVRATLRTSRGINIQRDRVRAALCTVDPVGTACRWGQVTERRSYSVQSPNSLWHLDNNHALKRWGFYVHGGIDGFSRVITFLTVTTSITGRTALTCFLNGVRMWGLPSRIRLDRGSEYNECQRFMEFFMGTGRGSAIRGKSVHNQRIERLWRDVYAKVLDVFYKLFYHLEDCHALDINNNYHMFALQYTFLPRIQAALTRWSNAHNCHGVRTEHHKTPQQLWLIPMVQQRCSIQANNAANGPTPSAVRNINDFNLADHREEILREFQVSIDDSFFHHQTLISEEQLQLLRRQIDPLRLSVSQGLDIYREVLNFLYLQNNEEQD